MIIDIIGYITQTHGNNRFAIKVTHDEVTPLSFKDLQVSREVEVFISPYRYPCSDNSEFEKIANEDEYRRNSINRCLSLSKVLKMGDRVKCSVLIVESETRNGVDTHSINSNRKDLEAYADFCLWLCPDETSFERLDVDTPETLKVRKRNYYRHVNRQKCGEITSEAWKYRGKWWINKNPKITFPMLWRIRFRTAASKLWEKLKKENNLTIALVMYKYNKYPWKYNTNMVVIL